MVINQPSRGVLRVQTPLGPRHFQPSFLQSLYLRWIFRHFLSLPVKVLSPYQLRFIERLCDNRRSLSWLSPDTPILGTLEQRPQFDAQNLHGRRADAPSETASAFATDPRRP